MQLIVRILLTLISVSPALALGEGNRNLLLIMAMCLSLLFIFYRYNIISKIDVPIFSLCFCFIFFPLMIHPETMRWSTVLYSCLFCLFFMVYVHVLFNSQLPVVKYVSLLKGIIFAFCIVLVLQQICVLLRLPIINLSNYDPETPWKLNSLSSEPSHSARFVAILMYSFLWMQDLIDNRTIDFGESFKSNKKVWLSFFWVMLTSGSGTAIILLGVIFLRYINKRHIIRISLTVVAVLFVFKSVKYEPIDRVYRFTQAIITFDRNAMIEADHSASLRLLPFMVCLDKLDLTTVNGWFGHGIDYVSEIMYREIPGIEEGYASGGYMLIALEYGFILFLILTCFTFRICYDKNNRLQSILLWLMCCFLLGVNIQIAWAFIFLSYTNKFYERKLL